MKNMVKSVLGKSNLGWMEFLLRHQSTQYGYGGPFNGQKFRQLIFFDLLYHCPIKAIVETGTFRGTTTNLFAATSLPVYTSEIHPRSFSYSKMRFLFYRDTIRLHHNDSRSFLHALSKDRSVPKENLFFYLDAHWKEDLPLLEELEIIFSNWEKSIVMVDDFQVPDSDYGFDDYGPGKALVLSYIDPVVLAHDVSVFFPAVSSSQETGAKRGSVVLFQGMSGAEMGAKIKTLVRDSSYLRNAVDK